MLNYKPVGPSRLGRSLKRLLDEAKRGLSRPNSWRMMMVVITNSLFSRRVSAWNGLVRETFFLLLSKAWVCSRSVARIADPNPAGGLDASVLKCCVLSGRGLYVGLIARQEGSYRLWYVCVRNTSIMRRPWSIKGCCAITFRCWPKHHSCHGMSRRMQALYAFKLPSCGER